MMLSVAGYYEKPFIAPRWEVVGNETFGVSPGMDALPDVISPAADVPRARRIGLAKQARPPVAMDAIFEEPALRSHAGWYHVGPLVLRSRSEAALPQ